MEIKENELAEFSAKQNDSQQMLAKRLAALKTINKNSASTFKYGLSISSEFAVEPKRSSLFRKAEFETKGKIAARSLSEAGSAAMESLNFENRLVAMNTAFLNSGIYLRIPKNTDAGEVHVKLKGTGTDFSHILVVAEEGSRATIIEEAAGDCEYRSSVVEVAAGENAHVRYGTVQNLESGKSFAYRKAVAERNAKVEWLEITTGSEAAKSETYTELKGEGSTTSIFTVFFGSQKQQFDFIGKCTHIGRNTESLMMTSGVLKDNAKAIQQGFAKINDKAYNASAHQKAKILLLSEGARASPIPKLEIDNNDVAATHEASVGQIDSEKIFYLMSRGIKEEDAKKLYVEGFLDQYTSMITVEGLRNEVEQLVSKRMNL